MRVILLIAVLLAPLAHAESNPDWLAPLAPFRIADNVYYVGSRDLASYLLVTPDGDMLINANLETSPAQIRASVETLGFRWTDIKVFLNSQAHFDHVGGAAQVLRETHARNMVMEGDAWVMSSGGRGDFSFGSDITTTYTPVRVDRVLHDGSAVTLGDPQRGGIVVIAHKTAGHTRGCTTFTLRSHLPGDPAGKLRDIVIVGGVAPLAHYRLVARPGHPVSYPGIAEDFERSFATLHALPCEVFLGAHGVYFDLLGKVARLPAQGAAVFIDPAGYQDFVTDARGNFESVVDRQRAASSSAAAAATGNSP